MKKIFQTPTGNSAEDEQNNRRHAKRFRVYLIILAVWIALLLILITILAPILVLQHRDNLLEQMHQEEERLLARSYATQFRDAILGAISAAYGLEGYIMGVMKSLPKLGGTPAQRMRGQYFPKFYSYSELLASSSPHVSLFATAPGGVILQVNPRDEESKLKGWDLLNTSGYGVNHTDPAGGERENPFTTIKKGELALTGPYKSPGLPLLEEASSFKTADLWWVDLRQPIYNATSTAFISNTTFWGFAIVVFTVDGLMRQQNFTYLMDIKEMAYLVYTLGYNSSSSCTVIAASAFFGDETDCNAPSMQAFINEATTRDVLKEKLSWRISLKSMKRVDQLTNRVRNTIVLSSVIGVLLLFVLSVYIIVRCTRVYDGTVHAPKMAPFAMLTIGPCRGEELWDLAADQMVEVTERLAQVLAQQMVRHHAYQIQQVHPLTTSYVTRSVAAAVQMAFSTIEELHSYPIDDPLRRLLGDEGSLLVSYAVHWCTDAAVRVEAMGGGFRYEGPDVVYGGRMWVFAGPNVVTVSPAALPSAACMPHVKCRLFDSVFLRGVTTRQDLYVVTDTANHRLREAEAFAADQMRRARQAQLQSAADKEAELESMGYMQRDRLLTSYPQAGYDSSDLDGSSFFARGVTAYGLGAASRVGSGSNLVSLVNDRGVSPLVDRTPKKGMRRDPVVGGGGLPTAIVVPVSTSGDAVASRVAAAAAESPSTLSPLEPQRRMVRRPARQRTAANVTSVSSTSSSSVAVVQAEREGGMAAVTPQTPLGPPVAPVAGAAGTLRLRRGQQSAHASQGATTSGGSSAGASSNSPVSNQTKGVWRPDLLPTNPFVVVPPAATMAAEAHGLGSGGGGGSPTTPISEESTGGPLGNIPAYTNGNPLAHCTTVVAASSITGSLGGPADPVAAGDRGAVSGTLLACTAHNSEDTGALQASTPVTDNFSSDLLLRPAISSQSDLLLRAVFERQAVALDLSYDSVRVLVYYFYSSYKILFRPLAAPELHNIFRRLMTAFGVPQQGILEHLAARCATRFLQRHEETQTLLWDQQHRLQAHARSVSASAATATSISDSDEGISG
ncbi:hypothetical protein LSCM1_07551 [Leishmania martiniquensis]|uniref:CHASE domain-containing protein n=1 Tax=Leishmania martiniquensis TaxID=1580590 RepID=A0A836KTV1_9TRYP|nr:hypothetical protein LSCM1_07551 [Leishmania martiniquensis]